MSQWCQGYFNLKYYNLTSLPDSENSWFSSILLSLVVYVIHFYFHKSATNLFEIVRETVLLFPSTKFWMNSTFIDYVAATYACKAAIKAGDSLDNDECISLVDRLFATNHPYYCPHGRPIIVNLTIEDLDKRFERH